MAAGFEIIFYAPEQNLLPVRMVKSIKHDNKQKHCKPGDLLRVVTSRYNGIRVDRVKVNYDHFVSAYASSLNLFPGSSRLPQLAHLSATSLEATRQQLRALLLDHDVHGHVNWQVIVDMTVEQFSRHLRELVASRFTNMHSLSAEIPQIRTPYVDPYHPNPNE